MQKDIFEDTMAEKFPNLITVVNAQIQKTQWIPSMISTPKHIIIYKSAKETALKSARVKKDNCIYS